MAKKVLKSPTNSYEIVKELGRTGTFNLYLCETGGRKYILKVALTVGHNGLLDREALMLRDMREEAARLETEYATVKTDTEKMLNYQLCFPYLVESFIAGSQGNRRINILGFNAVEDMSTLVPIRHVVTRDGVRVDPKTSAWMMGKLLKILVFAHSQGISVGAVTGDNVLIERDEHYVVLFDWTGAQVYAEEVPEREACREITQAARIIVFALGGDITLREFYEDEQDPDGKYVAYLFDLAAARVSDAQKAHEDFYTLVRSLWSREYWPFTSYPLEG